jgi:hypothetical protein
MIRLSMSRCAVALAASAMALVGIVTPAAASTPAGGNVIPLGTCGQSFHPVTTGGEAAWNLVCASGGVTIAGWVKDTKADGKCAFVKAFAGNGASRVPLASACPAGTVRQFSWRVTGTNEIRAYLYIA